MPFVLKPVASSLKPLLAAFVALAACLGCSNGASYPHGAAVGMVTVDGQPAPHGTITFNPVVTPGTNEIKPVTGATIEEGHYRCERVPIGKLTTTFTLHGAGMRNSSTAPASRAKCRSTFSRRNTAPAFPRPCMKAKTRSTSP